MSTEEFAIEVDFLPVGEGSRSADAIALRYGDLASGDRSKQMVIVVDGGTKESGKALLEHLKEHYHTNVVDLVIMTHPDTDHASGLTEILESCTVHQLCMHQPWNHSADIRRHFHDGRITDASLEKRMRLALDAAHQVEKIALEQGIEIIEPFAGLQSNDGIITVLGPSREYYQELLPEFRSTPESVLSKAFSFVRNAIQTVSETLATADEQLPGGETSAENNSSAILLLQVGGQKVLLVGDAGVPALDKAAQYAAELNIRLDDLDFMQIPHHGSRKNVSSAVLDRIKARHAFISAAKQGGPKHPSQRVINALVRRNTSVSVTQGNSLCFRHNAPTRENWGPADLASFQSSYAE